MTQEKTIIAALLALAILGLVLIEPAHKVCEKNKRVSYAECMRAHGIK